jgi:hypothetical protein
MADCHHFTGGPLRGSAELLMSVAYLAAALIGGEEAGIACPYRGPYHHKYAFTRICSFNGF